MDDFKITKVEINPNTEAVKIEALKDKILIKIESCIRLSGFSNKYYVPLHNSEDYELTNFISTKLNSFAQEFRIPFSPGTCPECEYKKDLIKILKLLLFEEEL